MGVETFDLVIHCDCSVESILDCLNRIGATSKQRAGFGAGLYSDLVHTEFIIEFQLLEDPEGVRVSMRSALCCAPQVVDKMVECATLISRLASEDVWNVMGEHTKIKASDKTASTVARKVFDRRRGTLLKSFGTATIPNAALRPEECIDYISRCTSYNNHRQSGMGPKD